MSAATREALVKLYPILAKQRVLLVTSIGGAKRRSTAFVNHVLRNDLRCTVQSAAIAEPSVAASVNGSAMLKRTQSNIVIGLGGSTIMDAVKFFGTDTDAEASSLLIPTVPMGGKEYAKAGELFDWEKEQRLVFPCAQSPNVILDPSLALEDKVEKITDLVAYFAGFSLLLNQKTSELVGQGNLIATLRNAFDTIRNADTSGRPFSSAERSALFEPSKLVNQQSILEDLSVDMALSNILVSRVALPRSKVRIVMLEACLRHRMNNSIEFSRFIGEILNENSMDDSLKRFSSFIGHAGCAGGLQGLLHTRMDAKAISDLKGNLSDWIDEAAGESVYRDLLKDKDVIRSLIY